LRTLASIKKIASVSDIKGKDRIGLAMVDGWSVIVKKDEFKEGDLCVFCEIDSLMPDKPWFEFLKSYGGKSLRIKTMKMAGVISQGICFPLSIFENYGEVIKDDSGNIIAYTYDDALTGMHAHTVRLEEGTDVTENLLITKWEPIDATDVDESSYERKPIKKYPRFLMRFKLFRQWVYKKDHRSGKGFPSEVSKTDETRIQNAPFYLDMDTEWTITEKIDGQSGTFLLRKTKSKIPFKKAAYEYIVCSRNLRLYNKNNSSYWAVSDRYGIENKLKYLIDRFNLDWVAIQGECIAPGVQGNKYCVGIPDLYVFNLITSSGGRTSSIDGRIIIESLGMKWVPIIEEKTTLPKTIQEMLDMAHGDSALGHTIREGLVCRSIDGKQSFKAVDPLFLIKYDA